MNLYIKRQFAALDTFKAVITGEVKSAVNLLNLQLLLF